MPEGLGLPSVWSRVSYGRGYSVAGHLCQPLHIYSVACLSTFYVGKAHLVEEEMVTQSGRWKHSYSPLCGGGKAGLGYALSPGGVRARDIFTNGQEDTAMGSQKTRLRF